jgi:hypothetical protein
VKELIYLDVYNDKTMPSSVQTVRLHACFIMASSYAYPSRSKWPP